MATLTFRQIIGMTVAVAAIAALRLIFGAFSLQGALLVVVTAVVSWRIGPWAGALATALGAVAANLMRFGLEPQLLQAPWFGIDRTYLTGFATYFVLSGLAIAIGRRHLRIVHELRRSRLATQQAEAAHRQQLEAALQRETAARRDAEQANQLREALLERVSQDLDRARDLAAIVESSEDAIVGTDLESHITSWNRAATRLFGYQADEMLGRSVYVLIPEERRAEERDILQRLIHGETAVHFETVRHRRDGSQVPIAMTVSPIRDDRGRVVGASKIARDISERKRAEAAVADLQGRLVSLVAASGFLLRSPQVEDVVPAILSVAHDLLTADGYAVWRRDMATDMWQAMSSSGVSAGFVGASVPGNGQDLNHGPLAIEDIAGFAGADGRREAFIAEGIQSLLAVPLFTHGYVSGMVTFYYRNRHRFADSEVQAARAFGNLAATALTTAELYDIQQRSRRAADLLVELGILLSQRFDRQRTLEDIARRTVPFLGDCCAIDLLNDQDEVERVAVAHVDPARLDLMRDFRRRYPDVESAPASFVEVMRTCTPVIVEWLTDTDIETAAGQGTHGDSIRALGVRSFMVVPLVVRERSLGAIGFMMGPSGRRYSRGDLRFVEALASRVALAVDNARAYEEATRANQIKDEFLATLSHELRTPLNAIVGYVRMLSTGMLTPERSKRALVVLDRNATALTRLVEDVLDVSRFAAGKARLDVRPVDVGAVVEQAIVSTRPTADAKGVRLEATIDPGLAPVSGDPDRLQQIAWNLLSNAVKFTDRGGLVHVRVAATATHIELVVTDTGCGIAPAFLPHVFERFRQGDARFARAHNGLGLGLAIVRDLVHLHGGAIHASSDGEGQGATFRVQLPVQAAPGVLPVAAPTAAQASSVSTSRT